MTIAICPGPYDPITTRHLNVTEYSMWFFDEVHMAVAVNAVKTPMSSETIRVDVIRRTLGKIGCRNVTVSSTDDLITDYCRKVGATVIIKGPCRDGDYEAELGMVLVNCKFAGIETLSLPVDPILEHISSSTVKDVACHGGDVTGMVSDCVVPMLADALAEERQQKDRCTNDYER